MIRRIVAMILLALDLTTAEAGAQTRVSLELVLLADATASIAGGPGALVVTADSAATFADAVRRKLILEIAGEAPARRAGLE